MGKANRQRRATKAKARKRATVGGGRGSESTATPGASFGTASGSPFGAAWAGSASLPDVTDDVRELVSLALGHLARGRGTHFLRSVHGLADAETSQAAGWRRTVDRKLSAIVLGQITDVWRRGWEPADVVRALRRLQGVDLESVGRDAIAAELARYAPTTVSARWHDQLVALDATVRWPRERNWMDADVARPRAVTIRLALELADALARLPDLERLGPIPGEATHVPATDRPDVDRRILEKVRALLAKAESTPYPAEAETFTAGAHAMMARHRIDRALLDATRPTVGGPQGRRIGIDNPYEAPKAMLLQTVADASQCRMVWSKALGFATVIGRAADLDAVELLFTSLLVQATTAMTRQGSRQYADGASRTRSFRQSFLMSYAHRLGERLAETTEEQTRQVATETGRSDLLPVLASARAAVDEATAALFPSLITRSVGSANDREGWASGRAAADLASLRPGPELTGG